MLGKLAESVESNLFGKVRIGTQTQTMLILPLVLSANVVETVLDTIVGTARNHFGHLGPVAADQVV